MLYCSGTLIIDATGLESFFASSSALSCAKTDGTAEAVAQASMIPAKARASVMEPLLPAGDDEASERHGCRDHQRVTFDAPLHVELRQPARRELDLAAVPFPVVGDDGPQRERMPLEAVEPICGRAFVVFQLFDPATHAAHALAVGESLDQLRIDAEHGAVLVVGRIVLRVEIHGRDGGELQRSLLHQLRVADGG